MNLVSTHKAALLAQCTPDNIRYHARRGRLWLSKSTRAMAAWNGSISKRMSCGLSGNVRQATAQKRKDQPVQG